MDLSMRKEDCDLEKPFTQKEKVGKVVQVPDDTEDRLDNVYYDDDIPPPLIPLYPVDDYVANQQAALNQEQGHPTNENPLPNSTYGPALPQSDINNMSVQVPDDTEDRLDNVYYDDDDDDDIPPPLIPLYPVDDYVANQQAALNQEQGHPTNENPLPNSTYGPALPQSGINNMSVQVPDDTEDRLDNVYYDDDDDDDDIPPPLIPLYPVDDYVANQQAALNQEQGHPTNENPLPNSTYGPALPQSDINNMSQGLDSNLTSNTHQNTAEFQNMNYLHPEDGPQVVNPDWMSWPDADPLPVHAGINPVPNNREAEFHTTGNGYINMHGEMYMNTPQNPRLGQRAHRFSFQSNHNTDMFVTQPPVQEQLPPDVPLTADHETAIPIPVPLPLPMPVPSWPYNQGGEAQHGLHGPHDHDQQQGPPGQFLNQHVGTNDFQPPPEMDQQGQDFVQPPVMHQDAQAQRQPYDYRLSLRELRHYLNQYRHELEQYQRVHDNFQRQWREFQPLLQQQQQQREMRQLQRRQELLLQLLQQQHQHQQQQQHQLQQQQPHTLPQQQEHKYQQQENQRKRKHRYQDNKITNAHENESPTNQLHNSEDTPCDEHQQQQQYQDTQKTDKAKHISQEQAPKKKKKKKTVNEVPTSKNCCKEGRMESKPTNNQSQQILHEDEQRASAPQSEHDNVKEFSACSVNNTNLEVEHKQEIADTFNNLEMPAQGVLNMYENVPDQHNQRGLQADAPINENDETEQLVQEFGQEFGRFTEDLFQRLFLLAQEHFSGRNEDIRDEVDESEACVRHLSNEIQTCAKYENEHQHSVVEGNSNPDIPKYKCKSKICPQVGQEDQNMPSTNGEAVATNLFSEKPQDQSTQNIDARKLDIMLLENQLLEQIEFHEKYQQELEELHKNPDWSKKNHERTAHWVATREASSKAEVSSDGLSEEYVDEQFRISDYFQRFKRYTLSDMLDQIQFVFDDAKRCSIHKGTSGYIVLNSAAPLSGSDNMNAVCGMVNWEFNFHETNGRTIGVYPPMHIRNLIARWLKFVKKITPVDYLAVVCHLVDKVTLRISDGETHNAGKNMELQNLQVQEIICD